MRHWSLRLVSPLLLVLGVFSIGTNWAIAAPASTPTAEPTQSTLNNPNDINRRLLGQWLTKEPLGGEMVMFVFAPDGQAYLVSGQSPQGNALAKPMQYRVNGTLTPIQIDLVLGKETIVQTILEFAPAGDLRLQITGTAPGKPRPTTFDEAATTFLKISDATTLPPNTEVLQSSP